MKLRIVVLSLCSLAVAIPACAHGPQIQTTLTAGKIVTREVVDVSAYHAPLTDPKTVYVMPLAEYLGVWRAQPDGSLLPDSTPAYVGWPGFAYGYGYSATTHPAPFPIGSKFILGFTAGLKSWNGSQFADAGATEAEAYRGSSATPSALAKTSDTGPFQSLMFPSGAGISFAAEGSDTHNTVHYRMLGDGVSTTSALPDGIYLLSMQLASTDATVTASDPFFFVLHKNPPPTALADAVHGLGVPANLVQILPAVPEPAASMLIAVGLAGLVAVGVPARRSLGR